MQGGSVYDDWTGNVVVDATVRSLDPEAVRSARASSALARREVPDDDTEFLSKAGLLKRGRITNAAMVLLGKQSENVLRSTVCIRWRLFDEDGRQSDSRVFRGPAVLASRQAVSMVRNVSFRIPDGGGYRTVSAYRVPTLLEAVMNGVVHQDFSQGGTVDVVEREGESVSVVSRGRFPDVRPEEFALGRPQLPPPRNPFLSKAAAGLGVVPGTGSGIRGMYMSRFRAHMPPPRFCFLDGSVSVTFGGIRRGGYCALLDSRGDLDLETAIDLDRVDRGLYVPGRKVSKLERRGLVSSDGGMLFLASGPGPAAPVPRGTDRDAVVFLIERDGETDRSSVASMLRMRDPGDLTDRQSLVKATNLLQAMKRDGTVEVASGSTKSAKYVLRKRRHTSFQVRRSAALR